MNANTTIFAFVLLPDPGYFDLSKNPNVRMSDSQKEQLADVVRGKVGIQTADVRVFAHSEWNVPRIGTMDQSEVVQNFTAVQQGIRQVLQTHGVPEAELETLTESIKGNPNNEWGFWTFWVVYEGTLRTPDLGDGAAGHSDQGRQRPAPSLERPGQAHRARNQNGDDPLSKRPRSNRKIASRIVGLVLIGLVILLCVLWERLAWHSATPPTREQEPSPSAEPSSTPEPSPSPEPSSTPVGDSGTRDSEFELAGVWISEDVRASDGSWELPFPLYMVFTGAKQYTYHGTDAFNSGQLSDEAELVYVDGSTFIKQITYAPNDPDWVGKYEKWSWYIDDGTVFFTIYQMMDSEEESLRDDTLFALATATQVE